MGKETGKPSVKVERLTVQEQKLLEIIRSMDYGEMRVVITEGKPTRIEEIKRSIKL